MKINYEFKKSSLRPDITPLIDVIFLLLIFFMIGSQLVNNTAIKVKLPRSQTAKVQQNQPVRIGINQKGDLFFDDKLITYTELEKILLSMEGSDINVVADKKTAFANVIKVWDMARKYRLKEINIETVS